MFTNLANYGAPPCRDFFPTCQVRVAIRAVLLLLRLLRLLCLLRLLTRRLLRAVQIPVGTAGPPPRAPDPSGHCRTSTASCRSQRRTSTATSRSQWALPDLNRELQIPVGTAGPQPQAPDRSGHCRTSTASSRSQWALPDLNRELQIGVGTAGPQPRAPDPSGHCRTSTASCRSQRRTSTATSRSQWALPDLNRELQIAVGTAGPQPRAPDPSGHWRTSTAR